MLLLLTAVAHAGGAYDREGAEPAFWVATIVVTAIVAFVAWMFFEGRRDGI